MKRNSFVILIAPRDVKKKLDRYRMMDRNEILLREKKNNNNDRHKCFFFFLYNQL